MNANTAPYTESMTRSEHNDDYYPISYDSVLGIDFLLNDLYGANGFMIK